jgi:hypothetical protein
LNGRVDAAIGLRAWIKGLFPDALFPFVDHTGPLIAKTVWRHRRTVVAATALFMEPMGINQLINQSINHCQSGSETIDWAGPV